MKKIKENSLLIVLFLFTVGYAYLDYGVRYNFIILSVFLLIGLLSLFGLFFSIDKNSVSINKTFCLFFYFFFSLAPIIQFKNNSVFFINRFIDDALYLKSSLVILIVLFCYQVLYHLVYSHMEKQQLNFCNQVITKFQNEKIIRIYVLSGLSVLFYLYLIKFNWDLLIYRPFVYRLKFNTNLGLIGYSLLLIVQVVPFICLVYYKLRNPKDTIHTFVLLALMFIVCFPTALSRGIVAVIYISLFLLFFSFLHERKNYIKMYFLGVLVVFPLLNNFRYLYEKKVSFNYQLFDTGHFDSFQNFSFLLEEKIITNGRQLLGSIFFFVQESQWTNRPTGTGALLANKLGYSFTNVPMPFFGEGYANFGYLGILLFLIIIAFFNAAFDNLYARGLLSFNQKTIYFIFMGLEFLLLRGDLMNGIKILASFGLALLLVELCLGSFIKRLFSSL